tara:strand:+ start:180 stop:377 length:198 start_codon:yes stop_codon:yes gene_type:complete
LDESRLLKLKVAAMVAVILEVGEGGEFLQLSLQRDRGKEWVRDHRRVIIGRRNLFRAKSKRSSSR